MTIRPRNHPEIPEDPLDPRGEPPTPRGKPHRPREDWHYHFLGIGGIGMSGIAGILHGRGFRVSGSDSQPAEAIAERVGRGISVVSGHPPEALAGADAVVYSTAVPKDHPIWDEVRRRGLPAFHRAELLGGLAAGRRALAVAGTHGKTTTTAALGHALAGTGWDPTVLVGGDVGQLEHGNFRDGGGEWLVCEADESDGSFVNLSPEAVLLTNVEADHLDHHGTLDNLLAAFGAFLERLPGEHPLVYCADDGAAAKLAAGRPGRSLSYGTGADAQVRVRVEAMGRGGTSIVFRRGERSWGLTSPLLGHHNALNLCGAFALGLELGVPEQALLQALSGFRGVDRRQQYIGALAGLELYDDYAHHPTEIRATLEAFLAVHGEPLTVVFQPHLYSRTALFADEFAAALRPASRIYVTEVYGAREAPRAGISGRLITDRLNGHPAAFFLPRWQELVPRVRAGEIPPGVLLTLGAGDVTGLAPLLLKTLSP